MKGIGLVEVAGEVDLANISLLVKGFSDAIRSGRSRIILDAQGLAYMDSAGLQTLISVHRKLQSKGGNLVIAGCHGVFQRLMEISKLNGYFRIYSNVDEAVADLTALK
jgi:anti-sigma B factor antagonist